MIEHFYEITKESSVFKKYFDYPEKEKKMRTDTEAFMKTYSIKTNMYILCNGKLWVEPKLNKQLYSEQFGKERLEGLAPFKKNSPIGKAFTEKGIKKQTSRSFRGASRIISDIFLILCSITKADSTANMIPNLK